MKNKFGANVRLFLYSYQNTVNKGFTKTEFPEVSKIKTPGQLKAKIMIFQDARNIQEQLALTHVY